MPARGTFEISGAAHADVRAAPKGFATGSGQRLSWVELDGDAVVFDQQTLLTHRLADVLGQRWTDVFGDRFQPQLEPDALDALDELGLATLPHAPPPSGETWDGLRRSGQVVHPDETADGPELAVAIAGRRVRVRCGVPEIERLLRDRFELAAHDGDAGGRRVDADLIETDGVITVNQVGSAVAIGVDDVVVQQLAGVDEAAPFLWWAMNLFAVSHRSDDTLIHAAAASRDGQAIVLTGASGAGKSTLLSGLAGIGLAPLSDEITRMAGGRVQPWRAPIDIDERSRALLGQSSVSQERSPVPQGDGGDAPADVAVLAVVSHQSGEPPAEVVPIDRFSMLATLLAAGFHPDGRTCDEFDQLAALVQRGTCVHCYGSDPGAKAKALADLLGG